MAIPSPNYHRGKGSKLRVLHSVVPRSSTNLLSPFFSSLLGRDP
jgi:hypothetical protein